MLKYTSFLIKMLTQGRKRFQIAKNNAGVGLQQMQNSMISVIIIQCLLNKTQSVQLIDCPDIYRNSQMQNF